MFNTTGTIDIEGFKLQYRIEGEGIPTLVIGSSIYYSRTFSQNLRNHLRLVFIDHRGFVPAPGPLDTSAFKLEVLLDDIERMRQTLELGRVIVIGHSGHGYMALEYAKKYPHAVSHVVLIGMGPDQSIASQQAADQYLQDSVAPERKKILEKDIQQLAHELQVNWDQRFILFCIRLGARSWYDFTFDASPLWENVYVNMHMFDYVWGTIFRDIDITKGLETFDKPVLLCLGKYDFLVAPFYSWSPIRSKFRNLTARLFEQSGHTPQFEEPTLFDAELLQWLSH